MVFNAAKNYHFFLPLNCIVYSNFTQKIQKIMTQNKTKRKNHEAFEALSFGIFVAHTWDLRRVRRTVGYLLNSVSLLNTNH